jgi:hypothetical protein
LDGNFWQDILAKISGSYFNRINRLTMRKTKLIYLGIAVLVVLAATSSAFARSTTGRKEPTNKSKSILDVNKINDKQPIPKPLQIIYFDVRCPDGTYQMAGVL